MRATRADHKYTLSFDNNVDYRNLCPVGDDDLIEELRRFDSRAYGPCRAKNDGRKNESDKR